jgi:hypothetical protein
LRSALDGVAGLQPAAPPPDRPTLRRLIKHSETEPPMAKGQKKSNREIRKPKKEKPKPAVPVSAFAKATGSK